MVDKWLTPDFSAQQPELVQRLQTMLGATSPSGYAANCLAVRDSDLRAEIQRIQTPTLVIAGALDAGTPPVMAERIAARIPGAALTVLPEASHLSVLEQPQAFMACLDGWLARLPR